MKEKLILKPNIDERPFMISIGVLAFYFIIEFFVIYLFWLHRINLVIMLLLSLLFTLIYLPRFFILAKLRNKDKIQIIEDFIMINDVGLALADIQDFRVELEKPQVVFFINNKMIVFQRAKFHLRLDKGSVTFSVIGGEKIKLLEEFLKAQIAQH